MSRSGPALGPSRALSPEQSRLAAVALLSPLPGLLISLPSGHILASSSAAVALLAPGAGTIEGLDLDDFAVDTPSGALRLLHRGRISGYETVRWLKTRGTPAPYRVWLQATGTAVPVTSAFMVLASEPIVREDMLALVHADDWVISGSADRTLLIDGISSDVDDVLGVAPADLLGLPLLALVKPAGVGRLLTTLAETIESRKAGTTRVTLRTQSGSLLRCLLLILPLEPAPRCNFAFVPFGWPTAAALDGHGIGVLQQLVRGATFAPLAPVLQPDHHVVGLSRLTERELDIVNRLLTGDRVPSIAAGLHLGQSTVRNHLSSVFAKLRVGSQQQLLDLLLAKDKPPILP